MLTAIYLTFNLFACPWKRQMFAVYIYFKETLLFNFLYKLFLNILNVFIIQL